MSFRDIKGQDSAIRFLKNTIENNRTAHAYIFLGSSGVGRKKTALNFAKALNCLSESPDKPCGQCASCKKIERFNHPDIFLLSPEKKGSSIKIERMRELIKNIGLKPYEAKMKVYIIDDAHQMTQEAENALLKTLEEPPSESILILITEDLSLLFQTIVSRSQVVRFFPLGLDEVKEILIKEYKIDAAQAHILSHLSSGSIGEALKYKDEKFFDRRESLIRGLLKNAFLDLDFDDVPKEDLRLSLDIMLTWYRDILVRKLGLDDSRVVNIDKLDNISKEAKRLDADYLDGIIREIILTNSFLDQNANPKLAMSVLGLKIGDICTK